MAMKNVTAGLARVVDVDVAGYTVTVVGETEPFGPFKGVPFSTPYCNNTEGEGLTAVPEVGSQAIVMMLGDSGDVEQARSKPVVLGFLMTPAPPPEDSNAPSSYRGNRPVAQPGDIYASTRDGNYLFIRRGGVVQIGASPIAQRLYMPLENLIRDICQEYRLECFGGTLEWFVDEVDQADPDAELVLKARERATDKEGEHSITLKIGKVFNKDNNSQSPHTGAGFLRQGASSGGLPNFGALNSVGVGYIELEINPQQQARKFILRIDQQGNSFQRTEGSKEEEIAGSKFTMIAQDFYHQVSGGYTMSVGNVTPDPPTAGCLWENVQGDIKRESGTTIKDKSRFRIIEADDIRLGSSTASQPAVLGAELVSWLAAHTHPPPGDKPAVQVLGLPNILSSVVKLD